MYATNHSDVLVVGAGLAGLTTAWLLHHAGRRVTVLEAQSVAGGRIRSVIDPGSGEFQADLGPTWIWTSYQPIAANWLERLGLAVFPQFDAGDGIIDQDEQSPPTTYRLPGQDGSMRVVGGSQAMVDRLIAALPKLTVRTSCPALKIDLAGSGVRILAGNEQAIEFHCAKVVIAMPLRRVTETITLNPELPLELKQTLDATPTWMAPQAKAVAFYESSFWRQRGLSGRLASRPGPLVEAHDHCGPEGAPAALFGFVGWPPAVRASRGSQALKQAIVGQLTRCFGTDTPPPLAIHVQDWAQCQRIASTRDLAGAMDHPTVGPETLRAPHFDHRLWFCTSETAAHSPGLIEGAFAAGQATVASILENE